MDKVLNQQVQSFWAQQVNDAETMTAVMWSAMAQEMMQQQQVGAHS
jgi:hypothetical protein